MQMNMGFTESQEFFGELAMAKPRPNRAAKPRPNKSLERTAAPLLRSTVAVIRMCVIRPTVLARRRSALVR
jgi:hypothetical protein